jgi:hypothetical protein
VNPEQMINQLSGRLSLRRRVAIVVAMLGGLAVAIVVGLLWATEPALPGRTRVAFGALVVVGLAWAGYGVWVLTRRTPLYALDRVIAAWLALTATSLLAGTVAVVAILRHRAEPVAAGTALGLLVVAVANLVRARARRAALLRRKRELGG